MNIEASKQLAEKLSKEKIIIEAIEVVYLDREELPEEIAKLVQSTHNELVVYVNPTEESNIVWHIFTNNSVRQLSYLTNEDGLIEKIYENITK